MRLEVYRHFGLGRLGKLRMEGVDVATPECMSYLDYSSYPGKVFLTGDKNADKKPSIFHYGSAFEEKRIEKFGILPDYNFGFDSPAEMLREGFEESLAIGKSYPHQGMTVRGGRYRELWEEFGEALKERPMVRIGNQEKLISRPRLLVEVLSSLREIISPNSAIYFPSPRPWHIPVLSFLGIDLFDNLYAYRAAAEMKYLTTRGEFSLKNMVELPCSCSFCSSRPENLSRDSLLAHNQGVMHFSLTELRESMRQEEFYPLLEERSQASPEASSALRIAYREKYEVLERYLPLYQ